ncbi:class I SAM-dependent methyltransferase [Ancylobacter oerskovii]|uniref:Class I SAM-dependent methyltransferase n=1 Tax=Ancylobacter oerskovii TaxID=459519 RepID=A0ABW4YVF3_9HYPH|nr:class I SAM-dependent methyltransferase [Ancylobacter oerskovii]MBS7543090.1 class I SAM-dependent methyltransferase [Ancylobacter oerskovii]
MKGFSFQGLKAAVRAQTLGTLPVAADSPAPHAANSGINGDLEKWLQANLAVKTPADRAQLAPFPPTELMHNTSGLKSKEDFARHGIDLMRALARVSPRPPAKFGDVLDFGVGVGRLARLFHGYNHRYVGVDIDSRHIGWIKSSLPHVEAHHTRPAEPLPLADQSFDTVVSISVFSHLCEADHLIHLADLARLVRPGGYLFLSVHGQRALARALEETKIVDLLSIPTWDIERARRVFACGSGYSFVVQAGHLTTDEHPYGITFISERYIRSVWSRWFEVVGVASGGIHDFQDIVVLKAGHDASR